MNIDHLRSNGHIVGSNGHSAQVDSKPKRVDYPRLLTLGHKLLLAIESLFSNVRQRTERIASICAALVAAAIMHLGVFFFALLVHDGPLIHC